MEDTLREQKLYFTVYQQLQHESTINSSIFPQKMPYF